jgi:hypothetical protein
MRSQNKHKELMYDECSLEQMDFQHTEELVVGLMEYCKELEKKVVELRCQANGLRASSNLQPYLEPHSDLYETFDDYAAYFACYGR